MNARYCIKAIISLSVIASLLLLSVTQVYGAVVLDSFTPICGNTYLIYNVHWGSLSAQAQSWNQGLYDKARITSIKVKASKYGSPTGYLKCRIASHTGTYGVSSKPLTDLEESTNSKSIATISSNDARPTIITFTFAGTEEILKDVNYVFYVYALSGSLDGSNYVKIWGDVGHDGNRAYPSATPNIWISSASDLYFQVYGEEIPSGAWHDVVSWDFDLTTRQWVYVGNWLFDLASPLAFPIGPILCRVAILVTLKDLPMDKINITVTGGPSNLTFWKMTDIYGEAILRLKKGTYLFYIRHDSYLVEYNISIMKHCAVHFELTSPKYRIIRDWTSEIIQIVSGASCFIGLLALYEYHEHKAISKQWKKMKALKGKPKKEIKKKLKGKR